MAEHESLEQQQGAETTRRRKRDTTESTAPAVEQVSSAFLVGDAADHAEGDADVRAEQAMRLLSTLRRLDAGRPVRRSAVQPGPSDHPIGARGGELSSDGTALLASRLGRGQPLEATLRRDFSAALGAPLPDVRIHDDQAADELSRGMSAQAFTVGRDVFFSRGTYRPEQADGARLLAHELSHVLDDDGADVRRSVTHFNVIASETYDPPAADVINVLADDHGDDIVEDEPTITHRVTDRLNNPRVRPIAVPTELSVDLNNEEPGTHPARSSKQQVVGQMGADEFFIRTGTRSAIEGGHLIAHEFWDTADPEVHMAGDYLNLIPMSRTMNVTEGWKTTEDQLKQKYADLYERKYLEATRVSIDIDRSEPTYVMTLDALAQRFGLHLDAGADPDEEVQLFRWFPARISASYKNFDTGSDDEYDDAEENVLHNFMGQAITSGDELIDVLKQTPLWERMDPLLRAKLSGL